MNVLSSINFRRLSTTFLALSTIGLGGCTILAAGVGGSIGRSIGETIAQEPQIEEEAPVDVKRPGFSFCFPRNWTLDARAENFDPDHHLFVRTTKKRGFEMIHVDDKVLDVTAVVQKHVERQRQRVMRGADIATFGTWGDFRGAGATLSGTDSAGNSAKLRIFAFVAVGRTYTVLEFATENDRINVDQGFGLIEYSFRVVGFTPPPVAVAAREGNVEARRLYLAGQFPAAVALLLKVQATCKKGCGPADRSAAWMLLGAIQARSDQNGATKTFVDLLRADPSATLDPALATPPARTAFEAARAQVPAVSGASDATPAAPIPVVPAELPAGSESLALPPPSVSAPARFGPSGGLSLASLLGTPTQSPIGQQVSERDVEELQQSLRTAGPDDPRKPDYYFRLGEIYAQQGRNLEAVKSYVEAGKFPQYGRLDEVLFRIASQLEKLKKDDQAREFLHRLVRDYPWSKYVPNAYLSFGEFYFQKGEMENAGKFYEKVTQFPASSVFGFALYKKGWVEMNLGNSRKALEVFVKIILLCRSGKLPRNQVGPLEQEAKNDLVKAYARTPGASPEKAWDFFQKMGGNSASKMLETLGEIYQEQGMLAESSKVCRTLLSIQPDVKRHCE